MGHDHDHGSAEDDPALDDSTGALDPWCTEHWNRIRDHTAYDSIRAAHVLPNHVLSSASFRTYAASEHDGHTHDALEAAAPLCCWVEAHPRMDLGVVLGALVRPDADVSSPP